MTASEFLAEHHKSAMEVANHNCEKGSTCWFCLNLVAYLGERMVAYARRYPPTPDAPVEETPSE